MTGMPECKPKCFGWKAKGSKHSLLDPVLLAVLIYIYALLENKDRRNYRQTYIGISKGLPAYQGFKGTWGQPETGLMRDEWTRLLGIFNKKFMIPRLPLLSLPAGQVPAHHVPSIHQHPTYSHHFPPGIYLSPYSPSLLPPPPPLSEPQFKPPPPDSHLWTNL
ncbi:hypothetical protein BDP27DRAFT_223325 [Rhodocollybia butyracea]|uniref:Uncharacterized protein n=1 Tax=Rhodocollybia butyracea TaxID=206335 RepID=A0A9P5Q343_9AGAR|nr:hypothetical protein BDP27DRAFT_223325 [Rhodocollybia butyracea]